MRCNFKFGFTLAEGTSYCNFPPKKVKFGFTLAEVLIVISIIGVVAALTIPVLTAKIKEKQTVTKVKEAYSILSQAHKLATEEYGAYPSWGTSETAAGATIMGERYSQFLKVANTCGTTKNAEQGKVCFANKKISFIDNRTQWNLATADNSGKQYRVLLLNGMSVSFPGKACGSTGTKMTKTFCGMIIVDIDGPNKGSTKYGEDHFVFIIWDDNSLEPWGNPESYYDDYIDYGYRSTYYIINKGKMDYLKPPYDRLQNSHMR